MRVFITVKTYPSLSNKYDELVCTAGITEDGKWIRVYPIPFRKLSSFDSYKKYQWIEVDLIKNKSDFRPESFRPPSNEIGQQIIDLKLGEFIDTDGGTWTRRKEIILNKVYNDMSILIEEAKNTKICTSLATFKPTEILDFTATPCEGNWDKKKLVRQISLFEDSKQFTKTVKKIPYQFKYRFKDSQGKISNLMIEDWEIGALYWNCLKNNEGNDNMAVADVRKKYFDQFLKEKELYFFLGTTQAYHFKSKNPFMIIGVFYPKKIIDDKKQLSLF